MPHLLVEGKKMLHDERLTHILVATSGDTGKAALAGYADLDGIRISVFTRRTAQAGFRNCKW